SCGGVRLRKTGRVSRWHEAYSYAVVHQQHWTRHRPPANQRERKREAGTDRHRDNRRGACCACNFGREANRGASPCTAEGVRPAGRGVSEVAESRTRPRREGAEAEQGESARFERGLTCNSAAHAGRRLPEGNALLAARRPGSEARGRECLVPANTHAGRRSANQVGAPSATRKPVE